MLSPPESSKFPITTNKENPTPSKCSDFLSQEIPTFIYVTYKLSILKQPVSEQAEPIW